MPSLDGTELGNNDAPPTLPIDVKRMKPGLHMSTPEWDVDSDTVVSIDEPGVSPVRAVPCLTAFKKGQIGFGHMLTAAELSTLEILFEGDDHPPTSTTRESTNQDFSMEAQDVRKSSSPSGPTVAPSAKMPEEGEQQIWEEMASKWCSTDHAGGDYLENLKAVLLQLASRFDDQAPSPEVLPSSQRCVQALDLHTRFLEAAMLGIWTKAGLDFLVPRFFQDPSERRVDIFGSAAVACWLLGGLFWAWTLLNFACSARLDKVMSLLWTLSGLCYAGTLQPPPDLETRSAIASWSSYALAGCWILAGSMWTLSRCATWKHARDAEAVAILLWGVAGLAMAACSVEPSLGSLEQWIRSSSAAWWCLVIGAWAWKFFSGCCSTAPSLES